MDTSEGELAESGSLPPVELLNDNEARLQRLLERERKYNAGLLKENDELKAELALRQVHPKMDAETQTEVHDPVEGETEWTAQAQEHGGSIADSVRSFLTTKNSEIERKEFVFNEGLGMYYNAKNGMMFDGKKFLYYDYQKNMYLYYDEDTGEYKEDLARNAPKKAKKSRLRRKKPVDPDAISGSSSSEEEGEVDKEKSPEEADAVTYPPCVRIMVFRSSVLIPGNLYIATCDRPFTIGRDTKRDMILEEDAVSKYHLVIAYDPELKEYKIQDYGSQNGTLLNGIRLSESKEVSEKRKLEHLDVVVIGSTVLVMHIHENAETCDNCEPGIMRTALQNQNSVQGIINNVTDMTLKEIHRQGVMQLKRKYGLQKDHFVAAPAVLAADYVDRARVRRDVVGSEHPSHERPTESASVSVPIPVENKGFQMLSKMGWTEGEGLNAKRKADSISEPISSVIRTNETAGLGSDVVGEIMSMNDARSRQQQEKWAKTVKRYHGLPTMNMRERTVDPGASQSGSIQWVRGGMINPPTNPINEPVKMEEYQPFPVLRTT